MTVWQGLCAAEVLPFENPARKKTQVGKKKKNQQVIWLGNVFIYFLEAGALLAFKKVLGKEPFFVIYGDNYTKFDLLDLKLYNQEMNADVSILYHWRSNITNSGISLFDEDSRVKKFIEKPKEIDNKNDWVNAGIYYFSNNHIINEIEKYDDFGKDLFPKLLGLGYNIFGLKKSVELIAVDTPELLKNNLANQ